MMKKKNINNINMKNNGLLLLLILAAINVHNLLLNTVWHIKESTSEIPAFFSLIALPIIILLYTLLKRSINKKNYWGIEQWLMTIGWFLFFIIVIIML